MERIPLFRQEAVNARRHTWLGDVIIANPLSRLAAGLFALSLATAVLLFLCLGQYTRREKVSGQLVPSDGVLDVVAANAGAVTNVFVKGDQYVHRGEPLVQLSSEQDSVSLGNARALISRNLGAQRDRFSADLQTQRAIASQQADELREKEALLRSQLDEITDQIDIQMREVASQQGLLDRIKPLEDKGYVSVFQVEQQQDTLLDSQAQYKTLLRQRLDLRQQVSAIAQQRAQLPLDASTQRNDTSRKLADIDQSIAQNEMQRAVVLRSPCDGIVSSLLIAQGQMVMAGQALLSVLPDGSDLQAQFLLPTRAMGFIEPGSQVILRYQAYPYQKFGQHYGRIIDISRNALTAEETARLTGGASQQYQEPLYRVRVSLDSQRILAYGKQERLRPGMTLDADILAERRRLIEWVFEPLLGIGHRFSGKQDHG